ncbi:glycosyltransferase [Mizugakiibacter sediminis]|uniref:glycosyltransferase n=1 Tax=Mizugakiibacter sediminis TaxID=1475481 RepID=UPI001F1EB475|nr:glycosyltransferase [Mizugakiibacter sediminis]
MASPLTISVALCTYNGAAYLDAQLDSLLAQQRRPDEIVVADDGSGDGTRERLRAFRARAAQAGVEVTLIENAANLGYVRNFEQALAAARGALLFPCDQDDVWRADKLARMAVEFERRPELSLLHTDARLVDAQGRPTGTTLFRALEARRDELDALHAGRGFDVLLRRNLVTGATVGLRRELLAAARPFPPELVHDEWLALIAAATGTVDALEDTLIDYRQHGGNQIGMRPRGLADKWEDLKRLRPETLQRLAARMALLGERLQRLGAAVPPAHLARVRDKERHLRLRAALPPRGPARLGVVLREARGGGYARYSNGVRSMLRDLLRGD